MDDEVELEKWNKVIWPNEAILEAKGPGYAGSKRRDLSHGGLG